ncbi:MAG: hypothetical protein ACK53Y_20850, partial [bacterium]
GFLIWGRASPIQSPVLPPTDTLPKVKKKSEIPTPPIPTINSSSESLLSNFSGEPQIVEFSTVSQLTPQEPASGTALSGPSLFTETTTDSVKGTYVFSLPLPLYCMQGRFFNSSLSSLLSVPVK